MTPIELRNAAIEARMRLAETHERRETMRSASFEGLRICNRLVSASDFIEVLDARREWEAAHPRLGEAHAAHCCATGEIDWVYGILRIVWDIPPFHVHHVLALAEIRSDAF